jgi:hypothetical protein
MFSSHLPLQSLPQPSLSNAAEAESRWADDDIPLGCECANPALQIERWGQDEAPQPLQRLY